MVATAMTLWFATQKTEEAEANTVAGEISSDMVLKRDLGLATDILRPRGGVVGSSSLPFWLASLLDTEDIAPPPPEFGPTVAIDPREPWISYDILAPAPNSGLPIEARLAKMGPNMRPTRGRKIYEFDPQSMTDLAKEVQLLPEDHLVLGYIGGNSGGGTMDTGVFEPTALDRLLRVLAHARDVRVNGEMVRIIKEAVHLDLVVSDTEEGGVCFWIQCRLEDEHDVKESPTPPKDGAIPGLIHFIPAEPGWVHRNDGTLRPLTPEATRLIRTLGALEDGQFPSIQAEELERFKDREWPILASRYPVEVHTELLPNVLSPEPQPRLYLSEPDDFSLEIRAAFAYQAPDADAIEIGPDSPNFLPPTFEGGPTLERNPKVEAGHLARVLTAVADAQGIEASELDPEINPWQLVLTGENALSFLSEQAPLLEGTFTIFGDENLNRLRISRGTLEASARVESHMDWFDLQLGFSSGERLTSAAEVLKAWKKQKRFVRMNDGSFARLPEAWLDRFGALLDEAEHARRETGGQLPRYMASMGAALENAVDNFQGDHKFESWKNLLANPEELEAVPPPKGLKATLRDYQQIGYTWLCYLADEGFGGCLADDMGLGKTIQGLAYILRQKEEGKLDKPVLVIAPTSVVYNWNAEAAKFCPKLKTVIYQGPKRAKVFSPDQKKKKPDVVITSYPLLRIDAAVLQKQEWHTVILDESQHIKNAESQTSQAAFKLNAGQRFVMTGTPLENRLDDLWSQYHFIMPGFLGRRKSFLQNYGVRTGPKMTAEILNERLGGLRDRIKPFMLRRLKQDVATELPPRTEMVLRVPLTAEEQRIYATVRDAYRAQVYSAVEEKGQGGASFTILEALLRLRQAACHPSLLPFDEAQELGAHFGSSKVRLLMETLVEIIAEGHKALIFSQWTSLLDLVQAQLKRRRISNLRLDGSTKNRGEIVDTFQAPDGPPVFLLSLKAGGTGLNLTEADYVIHLDPWWNPAVEAQANDRAHRIGQERPVVIIKLVSEGTVESKVVQLQMQKRALFEAAVNDGTELEGILDHNEIFSMLDPTDDLPEVEKIKENEETQPEPRRGRNRRTVRRRRGSENGDSDSAPNQSLEVSDESVDEDAPDASDAVDTEDNSPAEAG
jgi:superfamily II DNA or RNA helicase